MTANPCPEPAVTVGDPVNDRYFNTDHLHADLKGRSVRGGAVTMTAQAAKFVLGTGSTMILARLLTPEDYGLIAMVTAVTGFVAMFKDMGLSMATVQRAEINHGQISTLFWVNVAVSVLLMLAACALAPGIAWFYGEPRLTWITLALAGGFIFGGLTVQHQALLRRQMRFSTLSTIEVSSMVAGILTGVLSALWGLGYWSLVWMQLSQALAMALGVWITCRWKPGLPARGSGVRPMLAFGGNLTGFSIVNYFARNLDNVLIGWSCGSRQLGFYSKAYSLLLLPLQQVNAPISSVAIPALSRLQHDPKRYTDYYLKSAGLIVALTAPLVVFMAVESNEIVTVILGGQWEGAAAIFFVLSFACLVQPAAVTAGWVHVTTGRPYRMLKWVLLGPKEWRPPFPFLCWPSPFLHFGMLPKGPLLPARQSWALSSDQSSSPYAPHFRVPFCASMS